MVCHLRDKFTVYIFVNMHNVRFCYAGKIYLLPLLLLVSVYLQRELIFFFKCGTFLSLSPHQCIHALEDKNH